jgi:putative DNA primase/helicase
MRLPGFPHQKNPAQPFGVRVAAPAEPPTPYSDADFQAALAEADALFAPTNNEQRHQADPSSPPDMRQGYPDGHRTHELTLRAGWCLGPWNMSEDETITACLEWNQCNTPPLSEERVRSTVASIAKAEAKKRQGDNSQQQGHGGEKTRDAEKEAALIDELARLDRISYDRRRKEAASQLGISVTALDKAVERQRAHLAENEQESPLFEHWADEPWPEPVHGDALFLALERRIRSHVVMTAEAALTVALWVIFSWVHAEAAIHSPILVVTSPEAECGKTTLLNLLGYLVRRALTSVGISAAVLYRSIEKWGPTLIIDEADAAFVQNEELRTVVNSGWTRGQGVLRCEGDEHEPRLFPTFCPKAIGLKGKKLPDTTASRAIVIELKRKLEREEVMDFRHIDDPGLQELRQKLRRYAMDNVGALQNANPKLPDGFANRVAGNWHLLLAIAETAGGEWPEKAREAAAGIAKLKATLDATIGLQLLADIRTALGKKDCMFSATLIAILAADPEGPWAEYNRGKQITQKQVANRLKAYGIVSETLWINELSAKGYKRQSFEDVWRRYLPE